MTDKAVVSVDVATGKLLWSLPFPDEFNENIVTPVVAGDVLIVSGTRKGTFGYRLETGGTTWTPKQIWHNTDLPMYMSTPVADGDYCSASRTDERDRLFCLDARTGRAKWTTEGRAGTNASLQSAGPNLVVLTTEGELIVAPPESGQVRGAAPLQARDVQTWAHPCVLGSDASSSATPTRSRCGR